MQHFSVGDRVVNPQCPQWGQGKVLEDVGSGKFRIFFLNHPKGKTLISTAIVALKKVDANEYDKRLENTQDDASFVNFVSPKLQVERFLSFFPEGYSDLRYMDAERGYKINASKFLQRELQSQELKYAAATGDNDRIAKMIKQSINKNGNLVHVQEVLPFTNALKTQKDRIAEVFLYHLRPDIPLEERFGAFSNLLFDLGIAKWPLATYSLSSLSRIMPIPKAEYG